MIELQLKPTIYSYDTCREFVEDLQVGADDLTYFFISRILECKVTYFLVKDKAFIPFFARKSANITFITLKLSNFASHEQIYIDIQV